MASDANALPANTPDDNTGIRPGVSKDALKFADHLAAPETKDAQKNKTGQAPAASETASQETKALPKAAAKDDAKTAKTGSKALAKDEGKTTKELVGHTASINNTPKPVPPTAQKATPAKAPAANSVASDAADSAQQASAKDDKAAKSNTLVVKKSAAAPSAPKNDGDASAEASNTALDDKSPKKTFNDNAAKAVNTATDAKDANQPESWEKRLEDMLQFMGLQPSAMPRMMPALAILTGQLQDVEPEAIPSTLAQSPMLNNVLAADDPASVVEEVKPLGEWLNDMGWTPDTVKVQDPAAFQALMATPVSLKDVMRSFDVDVDRVVTEARIMQDTLPLEGATPYIERATRLRASEGLMTNAPKAEKAGATKASALDAAAKGDENPMELEFLGMLMNRGNDTQISSFNAGKDAGDGLSATSLKSLKDSGRPLTTVDQFLMDASSIAGQMPNADGLPKVRTTSENPFQTMDLRAAETFTFKPDLLRADGASARPEPRDWLEGIHSFQLQSDAEAQIGEGSKPLDSQAFFEPLQSFAVQAEQGGFQGSSSDGESENGALEQGNHDFLHVNHSQHTNHAQGAGFDLGAPEAAVPPQAAKEMVKHVFDNSTMLVEKGGGAIRLDIGNKELGAIDLAIEVKDNRVDIKIAAASPHAREILATELPKLKESLQSQNLNLSKVEIGLTGGSSWTSSDGRSSQREASSQTEEISSVGGTTSTRKSSRTYRQSHNTQNLQPDASGAPSGSIHVRV